ncbi:MAG: hypothetical protein ACP5TE_04485 [Verrucomicrobiia bacterium]|jgi:hypothetical protein
MKRFIEILALFAGLLILVLAISKAALVTYYPKSFYTANPFLYPIPELFIILASIIFEIFVGIQILRFWKINIFICGLWLLLFCVITGLYRLGVWLYAPKSNCHCFGLIGLLLGSGNYLESKYAFYLLLSLLIISIILVLIHFKNIKNIAIIITLFGIDLYSEDIPTTGKYDKDEKCIVISGYVTFNSWDRKGNIHSSNRVFCFDVYIAKPKWAILITFSPGISNITSCDGTNLYHLKMTHNTNKYPFDAAYIFPSNIPWPEISHSLLWWVYILTKEYRPLINGTNYDLTFLPAPFQPATSPYAVIYETNLKWSEYQPFPIKNAVFSFKKERLIRCMNSPFRFYFKDPIDISDGYISTLVKILDEYTNNTFIGGELSILSYTNTVYGNIPFDWVVIQYNDIFDRIYTYDNNSKKWTKNKTPSKEKISGKYYGKTTNINYGIFPGAPPSLRIRTTIYDYRLRDIKSNIDHIRYNNVTTWQPNQLSNKSSFSVIKVKSSKPENIYRLLIMFFIMIAIYLSFILWNKGRKKIKKTSENGG